jgi:MATE family multidrug resistance protein
MPLPPIASPSSTPPPLPSTWKREARLLLDLAIPTVVIQLGGVLPNFVCASYVGRHYGSVYLDGFTLANLMGNLFNLSLLQGLYTAADTLSPQAFGAGNYKEVGLIAVRGYLASLVLLIPINIVLMVSFSKLLIWIGEDVEVSQAAHAWYQIYACALPFYALYMVTWKFLSAQEIMRPLILVCFVSCGVILPIAMEGFTRTFGYLGSAAAIVTYQCSQAILLIGYLKWKRPHTPGTWAGFSWREALEWVPFQGYLYLGIGGMLASSEWIYWEILSLLIGTLGVVPLSVHTVPTQVLMVGFMIPLGIGVALAVRLGATLPQSVQRAKQLTIGTYLGSAALFGALSTWVYVERRLIFSIFTKEPEVLEGCERIWWKVSVYYFNLSLYGINMGIATGLGKQWMFGTVTVVLLWGFSLPGMYYFAIRKGGGVDLAWSWIYYPYIVMNIFFLYLFWMEDWERIRSEIRVREGMDNPLRNEKDLEEEMVPPTTKSTPTYTCADETTSLLFRNGHNSS